MLSKFFKYRKYFSSQCKFIESSHLKLYRTCKFKSKIMKYSLRCYKVGNLTLTKGLWNKTKLSRVSFSLIFSLAKQHPHTVKLTRPKVVNKIQNFSLKNIFEILNFFFLFNVYSDVVFKYVNNISYL